MIKTVIFDLGGVYFSDGTKRAIKIISQKYNISEEKVTAVLKGELGTKYRIGELSDEEFWTFAKKNWDTNIPSKDLAKIWLEGYLPIEGTSEIIDRLGKSKYEIIYLSDNVQQRVDYLEKKYPFLNKFKDGIFSHLAHTRKPDPAIYKMVLEKSSNTASECVYIDDKEELLKPAKALGIKTIHFKDSIQLENSLKNLGLKF
ncbi:hypothetical protein BVX95_01025 [archaeon D22]|nr:hypothetical protein BVX95_01025 [archaeon D22]